VAAAPSGTFVLGSLSAFLLFAVGWALVGIASVRARVLPPAAAWLLILGAILNLSLSLAALPLSAPDTTRSARQCKNNLDDSLSFK
jgi:hypothetical protein